MDCPGFDRPFQAVVVSSSAWQINIDKELDGAFGSPAHTRFERVLDAYGNAIDRLARRIDPSHIPAPAVGED
jgi:hypothetical protein